LKTISSQKITKVYLDGVSVEVVRKNIKNLHLSVHAPDGRVRISAPLRLSLDAIQAFVLSKLGWIRQQQLKFQAQEREPARACLDGESHLVWGKRCRLRLVEADGVPSVALKDSELVLTVRPSADALRRQAVLDAWYRGQVREAALPIIARWEPLLGVRVERLFVQRMKTRWGSCNPRTAGVRLNSDLARKPLECLEYVVVHEMAHLLEPSHNARFKALMDRFIPNWKELKAALNRAPLADRGV
jgi:predicted metal-dependent hydrolase